METDIISCQVTIPSLASVYNEYALKSQYDTSIYLQVINSTNWVLVIISSSSFCVDMYNSDDFFL